MYRLAFQHARPIIVGWMIAMIGVPLIKGTFDWWRIPVFLFFAVAIVLAFRAFIWGLEWTERRRIEKEFSRVMPIDARIYNVGAVVIDSEGRQLR